MPIIFPSCPTMNKEERTTVMKEASQCDLPPSPDSTTNSTIFSTVKTNDEPTEKAVTGAASCLLVSPCSSSAQPQPIMSSAAAQHNYLHDDSPHDDDDEELFSLMAPAACEVRRENVYSRSLLQPRPLRMLQPARPPTLKMREQKYRQEVKEFCAPPLYRKRAIYIDASDASPKVPIALSDAEDSSVSMLSARIGLKRVHPGVNIIEDQAASSVYHEAGITSNHDNHCTYSKRQRISSAHFSSVPESPVSFCDMLAKSTPTNSVVSLNY